MFTLSHPVLFHQTDAAGFVHFAHYYHWMEQTEHAFLHSLGVPVWQGQEGFGWPRLQASCQFKAPIRYGDTVQVHLTLARLDPPSGTVGYHFTFTVASACVATGQLEVAYVYLPAAKRRPLPAPLVHYASLSGLVSGPAHDLA
jgi:YbgC/YbaW family acyl-CoA thioester hydrolase